MNDCCHRPGCTEYRVSPPIEPNKARLASLGYPGYGEKFASEVLAEARVLAGTDNFDADRYIAAALSITQIRWFHQHGS